MEHTTHIINLKASFFIKFNKFVYGYRMCARYLKKAAIISLNPYPKVSLLISLASKSLYTFFLR